MTLKEQLMILFLVILFVLAHAARSCYRYLSVFLLDRSIDLTSKPMR